MYYEFKGCDNSACPDKKRGRRHVKVENLYLIKYRLGQAPGVGAKIPCPMCATGQIVRICSTGIGALVRGTDTPVCSREQSYMTRIEGQDTMVTFVDHPHTDPAYQSGLATAARRAGIGGLSKAYYNERFGRLCVDVASSVPDPLGKLKREGQMTRTPVDQPYKVRKPNRAPASGKKGNYHIPLRRVP
jgi:hypothetical protein